MSSADVVSLLLKGGRNEGSGASGMDSACFRAGHPGDGPSWSSPNRFQPRAEASGRAVRWRGARVAKDDGKLITIGLIGVAASETAHPIKPIEAYGKMEYGSASGTRAVSGEALP